MDESLAEINVVVGSMITTRPDEDREAYEEDREEVANVQDLLREEGIDIDLLSQPGTEIWEGGIRSAYDWYLLQRLAAHLERGDDVRTLLSGAASDGEDVDELLADIWEDEAQTKFPHLIKHRGEGGYYLPVEFSEPIWVDYGDEDEDQDDEMFEEDTTVSFGSSVALLRELTEVEELLKRGNIPGGGPRDALEVLRTAAQQSIDTGLPIILW